MHFQDGRHSHVFFSDRASKLIRLKKGFCQGPCKISSQSVKAFSSYRVNGPNTHSILYFGHKHDKIVSISLNFRDIKFR